MSGHGCHYGLASMTAAATAVNETNHYMHMCGLHCNTPRAWEPFAYKWVALSSIVPYSAVEIYWIP